MRLESCLNALIILAVLGRCNIGFSAEPTLPRITLNELNSRYRVIGALGHPVFTLHKVSGRFVAGAASKREFAGSVCLQISHVDDVALQAPIRIDFAPWDAFITLPGGARVAYTGADERNVLVGQAVTCYGYEDVQTEGAPEEARNHVKVKNKAEPRFYSILVIVKITK